MDFPFHTIEDEVIGGNTFWVDCLTNAGEIGYKKAVIIADFGMGSDWSVILYYAETDSPVVMYLKWNCTGNDVFHSWVKTHNSFDEFARDIGFIDVL